MRSYRKLSPAQKVIIAVLFAVTAIAATFIAWQLLGSSRSEPKSERAIFYYTGPYGGGPCVHRATIRSKTYCIDTMPAELDHAATNSSGDVTVDADIHYTSRTNGNYSLISIDKIYSITKQ